MEALEFSTAVKGGQPFWDMFNEVVFRLSDRRIFPPG